MTIDQTKAMNPTKINVIGECINCKELILLQRAQLYDISIDFPASLKLIQNSFVSWYQNINKKYVQLNKAHKFFAVRTFKLVLKKSIEM